eukprot:4130872-Ditylum_brightwellii.AAC.4
MSVCCLTSKQKHSVLCQGVTTISDMDMPGPGLEDIRGIFKVFNSLSDAIGGAKFGNIHYQKILALVMYAKNKKMRGKVVDAAVFTEASMLKCMEESLVKSSTVSKELEVLEPPKLQDGNFHKGKRHLFHPTY